MSSQAAVLVRGSINIDEFYTVTKIVKPGQTVSSRTLTKRLGGKGANQAKAVACAGEIVLLDGSVGGDDEGEGVKRKLCERIEGSEGRILEKRIVAVEGVSTGKAVIQLADDGENSIIILGGANMAPRTDPSPLIPPSTTHLLLANEIPLPSTLSYLSAASSSSSASTSKRVSTIFNPSPMPTTEELRKFPFEQVDWLLINEGEMEEISTALGGETTGLPSGEASAGAIQTALANAKTTFNTLNQKTNIICTLGSQGVIYVRRAPSTSSTTSENISSAHLPAARLLNPIKDTTGAGDCFMGFLASGLARLAREQGKSLSEEIGKEEFEAILRTCLTACSMCVESEGAQDSYRPLSAVLERMNGAKPA